MKILSVHADSVETDKGSLRILGVPSSLQGHTFTTLDDLHTVESSFDVPLLALPFQRQLVALDSSLVSGNQLPRPFGCVASLPSGIRLFVVSYDSRSILKSLWANQKVRKLFDAKVKGGMFRSSLDMALLPLEDVLEILEDICTVVSHDVGFTLRLGVDFFAQRGDSEAYFSSLIGLVDRFGLAFVKDPFSFSSYELYQRFTRAVMEHCFVVKSQDVHEDVSALFLDTPLVSSFLSFGSVPRVLVYHEPVDVSFALHFSVPLLLYPVDDSVVVSTYEHLETLIRHRLKTKTI